MMKQYIGTLVGLCLAQAALAQTVHISTGETVVVKAGEQFSVEGVTFNPTVDFALAGTNAMALAGTPRQTLSSNYISRHLQFDNTTSAFTGTVQFRYNQSELNGASEPALQLHIYNGTAWQTITTGSHDQTNNVLQSVLFSGTPFYELTLASPNVALPVSGLRFSALLQAKAVELEWETLREEGTKDFVVEHSTDGRRFTVLATLPAAGHSAALKTYHFKHDAPAQGFNAYRLLQRDQNGRQQYSAVRVVQKKGASTFALLGNRTEGGNLQVQVYQPTTLQVVDGAGHVVLQKAVVPGHTVLNVAGLSKGVYFLRTPLQVERILVP